MVRRVLWAAAAGLWVCACSAPALTPAIVTHFSLDSRSGADEPLSRLQVFASGDIVLVREQTVARQGASQLMQLSKVERVQVSSGTPGAVLRVERDAQGRAIRLHVGFDPDHPDRTLSFGVRRDRSDVDVEEDLYELLPTRGVGIRYGQRMYRLEDPKMWRVHLTYEGVDREQQEDVDEPPGWRVDGSQKSTPAGGSSNGKGNVEAQVNIGTKKR